MGSWFSCPFAYLDDLDTRLEAFLLRSLSFNRGYEKNTLLRSASYNGRDSEPATTLLKSYRSAKFLFERSVSLKRKEPERMLSFKTSSTTKFGRESSSMDRDLGSPKFPRSVTLPEDKTVLGMGKERNQAALKLQKVYKSFRTRRRLADCAIMVEQRWWKLLDFAELKRSSISFFDIDKPETAISRWSRARTRAAKVGKGLSKDEKARKLALQHWLEAIDPRHRYGHNLQFYYVKWLHCESKQPFFYWLDIGEGKEVNLEICPRSKLQQQCIKYLGPTERQAYEVTLQDGKFMYKQSYKLVDTTGGPRDAKWIFVLSTSKTLYVGMKTKGTFQHSSFLAGGATLSAGRLIVEDGILKAIWPQSGHYLPTEENFQEFIAFLKEHKVDLTDVKINLGVEEDGIYEKSFSASTNRSDSLWKENSRNRKEKTTEPRTQDNDPDPDPSPAMSRSPKVARLKLTKLEIPKQDKVMNEHADLDSSSEDGYETAEETFLMEEDFVVSKLNLFDDEDQDEEDEKPAILKEKIMKRIDSHKGMKSYQLGQHLTTRWSTGAGPRIGCMRDYPPELQFRVLEQANLSPRSRGAFSSPRTLTRFKQQVLINQNYLGLDTTRN